MSRLRRLAAIVLAVTMTPSAAFPPEAAPNSDLSASSEKARVHRPTVKPKPVYRWWRPADPSFDQHGRLYRPPPGLPCPIDLGYGRWTSCMYR